MYSSLVATATKKATFRDRCQSSTRKRKDKVVFFVGNWKVVISTVDEASEVICVAYFVVR